jgi:mRNA interferase HigB
METCYPTHHASDCAPNASRVLGASSASRTDDPYLVRRVSKAQWKVPADVKRQFGTTVDFVGDNRLIFDLGGNKYRLVVYVSYTFGRVLVKFIGTHTEYDRIDPETVRWRK